MKIKDFKVGLAVAEKLNGADSFIGGAEHDVIYLLPPGTELADEDKARLEKAGWSYSKQHGWYCHV
jgi:hypothetical protein